MIGELSKCYEMRFELRQREENIFLKTSERVASLGEDYFDMKKFYFVLISSVRKL